MKLDPNVTLQPVMSKSASRPLQNATKKLYRAIWRWHFWAGLITAPFLIIIAVTGALYVFEDELAPIFHPELYKVEPTGERVSLERMRGDLETTLPGFELHHVSFPEKQSQSWFAVLEKHSETEGEPGEHKWAFYDPYKGEVLGFRGNKEGFFAVVLQIHRNLLIGLPGRLITETATSWGIITMLSGLLLWWNKRPGNVAGVWLPRVKGNLRTILRDWHTVPGVYISLFLLLIMGTGLLFSKIWGTAYLISNAFTGGLPEFYISPPQSDITDDEAETLPMVSLDEALEKAQSQFDFKGRMFSIELPHEGTKTGIQFITGIYDVLEEKAVVYVDAYNGDVMLFETGEDFPFRTHITLLFYPIHTGSIFGLPTKILAFISCLLLIAMTVMGVWMWWIRRPKGKWGAPRKPAPGAVGKWLTIATILSAIFLPTVGVTLLMIIIFSCLKDLVLKLLKKAS